MRPFRTKSGRRAAEGRTGAGSGCPVKIVFLVGRAPERADGVKDHADNLADALTQRGFAVEVLDVDWRNRGLTRSGRQIARALRKDADHVVIHYSQLAWSKRALPLGTVAVAALTRIFCSGTLWVHDPDRIGVVRSRHRAGSFFKGIGLRLAIRIVGTGITSVHPSRVFWVTDRIRPRIAFCPTASNVGGADNAPPADRFTISLFDKYVVSDPSKAGAISEFVVALRERVGPLRIRVLGSGPPEAAAALARTLRELDVDADVPGHVTAEELRSRLAASHAFVVLRGPLSSRSGTVAAAIACGLPVVGFDGTETGPPLDAAGVIAVPIGDRAAIIDHLVRLEQRPDLRVALSKRSADVAEHTLNWRVTAELVERLLVNRSSGRTRDDRVGFDETFHD